MSQPFHRSVGLGASESAQESRKRFEALCLPYKADLYRFVFWLCRNRALTEDVMQETLLRAWRSIGTLGDTDAVRSWLLTIARRELARTFERKRPEMIDLDSVLDRAEGGLTAPDRSEIDDMRAAIMQLDESYREPLVLQVLFGYSTEQIARHLEISRPAVLTRLYRARHLLRRKLLGDADDPCGTDELS